MSDLFMVIIPLLLILYLVWRRIGKPKEVTPQPAVEERRVEHIDLEHLSQVWTEKEEERVISLEELSKNWRKAPAPREAPPPRPNPEYRHPEIAAFYQERVYERPNMKENVLACVEELLRLLDEEGDCPSVVNRNEKEVEGKLEKNVYDRLAELPLYRHSLNVAIELASHCRNELLAPMAIITGLAHDLGKIPAYQNLLYCTGDHPLIAQSILEKIKPFGKLTYARDVLEAVRQHHRNQPETELGKRLKSADQTCRSKEIAMLLAANREIQSAEGKAAADNPAVAVDAGPVADAGTAAPLPAARAPAKGPRAKSRERLAAIASTAVFGGYLDQDPDIFGAGGKETGVKNTLVSIDWFDTAKALAYLKQFINRMKGGRFYAFSMPDGTVYFRVPLFWDAAKRLSGNDAKLLAADADLQTRRDIIFSMVERLKESKAIATDLLSPGFFTGRFVINPDAKEPREENLIPFRAEAFGELVSTLEARKVSQLRAIKEVVPAHLVERRDSVFG